MPLYNIVTSSISLSGRYCLIEHLYIPGSSSTYIRPNPQTLIPIHSSAVSTSFSSIIWFFSILLPLLILISLLVSEVFYVSEMTLFFTSTYF